MKTTSIMHRTAYLIIGLLAGVLFAGHSASITPSALAQRIMTVCVQPTPTAPARTGRTITVKLSDHLWRLTLTGISVHSSVHSTDSSNTAKGKYILVYLTVQNLDKKPRNLYFDQGFSVVDSQGRTFGNDGEAGTTAESQANLDSSVTDVQPTFIIHTVFAFDVAKDAHRFKLQNTPLFSDNAPQTLFNLGM